MKTLEVGAGIGLVDEGQLGRMITEAAHDYGYWTSSLGPKGSDSPAGLVESNPVVGETSDAEAIHRLASVSDVITLDSEHGVNTIALAEIENSGKFVSPSPRDLIVSQDKWLQKLFMKELGVPFADCMLLEDADDLAKARDAFGEELIAKARTGAYDGRGNHTVEEGMTWKDIGQAFTNTETGDRPRLYIEKKLPFDRELASIVVKGRQPNDIQFYPIVETRQADHICDVVIAAEGLVDPKIEQAARDITEKMIRRVRNAGILAIEMFQTNGKVVVNEFALRVHNSGHWTDFGAVTSQFHQNVRAAVGMPLGPTDMTAPFVVMKNIIGHDTFDSVPSLEGITFAPNVHPRLYDKTPRAARKIGHFTVLGEESVEATLADAEEAHAKILSQISKGE